MFLILVVSMAELQKPLQGCVCSVMGLHEMVFDLACGIPDCKCFHRPGSMLKPMGAGSVLKPVGVFNVLAINPYSFRLQALGGCCHVHNLNFSRD